MVADSLLQLGSQTSALVNKTVSTFSALTNGSSSLGPQDLLTAEAVVFLLEGWEFPDFGGGVRCKQEVSGISELFWFRP